MSDRSEVRLFERIGDLRSRLLAIPRALSRCVFAASAAVLFAAFPASANEPTDRDEAARKVAAAVAAMPVATMARIVQSGSVTRLAFDVTSKMDVRAFVLADPDRVIVDLPESIFAIDPETGAAAAGASKGLIKSFRFGRLGPGRSRVVIDLARPAKIAKAGAEMAKNGQLRLLVDLAPTTRAAFKAAAADALRSAAPAAASNDLVAPADTTRPVIVLDPGHGGIDAGAMVKGRPPEKEIVFAFARTLEAELVKTGRYSVVLTRTDDVFVPLGERVQIARAANAQLFLSIHADSLNEGGVSGATVYTVSDKASDAHAARLAEKENFADKVAGFDAVEESGGVTDILFDLARRETRAYSHVFARTLVSVWKEAARLNKNPLRSAGFKVLQAPDVPSALLELGYLSSEKDSALLTDPEWRANTARAVARSIDRFFAMRSPASVAKDNGGVASIAR